MNNTNQTDGVYIDPGSHLNVVIGSLLDAAGDKEGVVRDSVCNALKNLCKNYAKNIVNAVYLYRPRNPKMSTSHMLVLLSVLESISLDRNHSLEDDDVNKLVDLCVKEITRNDSQKQVQGVASNILISLGCKHCNHVLSGLLPQLESGRDPQPAVITTLGSLASTNVSQFVPVIKGSLHIMITLMPQTRNDSLRIAFSFAVGRFSEAIMEYLSSDQDYEDSLSADTFSEEVCAAYDVIANSWVQAKDFEVAESSIRALGSLFGLLPGDKAMAVTQRALTCLLNAYKRPALSSYVITQCLASVLKAAPPQAVQLALDAVLFSLGNMVVVPPDYTLPHTVKQHSEVLRCYDHIGLKFNDRLSDLMVKHMRMGGEKDKVEALIVCAHLISSHENTLKGKIQDVSSALRSVLQDPSAKVKKALVKTIISLASKGHATDGSDFVEFLVRHCTMMPNIVGNNDSGELVGMCESALQLLSTTVDNMSNLLWVTLLKLLTDPSYDAAVPVITQTLAVVAPKIDGNGVEGEPCRQSVLCRCFMLLGSPLNNNRGPPILSFLQQFSSFISVHISDLWAHKLPQLENYLLVSEWSETEWESLLIELIHNTVSTISCHDSSWPVAAASQLSCLLPTATCPEEATVALSALAIATAVIEDKNVVSGHLDTILNKLKGYNLDSKSCSRAVGILSTAHLEMVLSRLESIAQAELSKRNSRLLGLMKDSKAEAEMEKCREALLQCYASIAQRCPLMELLPKMDSLTQWAMTQITVAKETRGREAALEAILNCAESLVRHKTEAKHSIKARSQILDVVMRHLQNSRPDAISLQVTSALVKLPPALVPEARIHILKTCFDSVLSQEAPVNGYDSSSAMQTLKCLGELVEEILLDSVTPDRLDEIVTLLEPWVKHRNFHQRHSAIITFRSLLHSYYRHTKPGIHKPTNFNQSGDMLGLLVVRCFDSSSDVGRIAAHCAGIVLAISDLYEGLSHDNKTEMIFEDLPEENAAFHITKVLLSKLPQSQYHKLTARLLDGLTDADLTACSNSSDILTAVFNMKGTELFHYVNDIIGSLLLQLTSSGTEMTNGVSAVLALARHHPKQVIGILLKQPLPFHSSICDCWKIIAHDSELNSLALDHLIQVMVTSELFDDYSNNSPNRPKIAALQPLSAVCGVGEMATVLTLSENLRARLHQLVPLLLTLTAAFIGSSPPVLAPSPTKSTLVITNRDAYRIQPPKVVKDCFQRVLHCIGCEKGEKALSTLSQIQQIDNLISIVPQLALSLCQFLPSMLPKLLSTLKQYVSSPIESQRIIIASFHAECLAVESANMHGDASLVDNLVSSHLTGVTDPEPTVKAISLKGLSSIANLPQAQFTKHEETVINALMQGLDDSEGNVHTRLPLEAMRSLSRLIPSLAESTLLRIQIPLTLRLKIFFEKEEIAMRSVSMKMVGEVCRGGKCVQQGYRDQLLSSFVPLLLHLSEPEPSVVKACKFTLRETSSVLGAERLAAMLRDHLIDEGNLQFDAFISAIAAHMVSELNEQVNNFLSTSLTYTRSNWDYIRGSAAFLAGVLFREMKAFNKELVDLDQVTCRLIQLMSDQSKEVRSKAALSLGTFFGRS